MNKVELTSRVVSLYKTVSMKKTEGACTRVQFFFFFLKISTRIHAMAYDEGAHPRVVTRLDDSAPEPHRLYKIVAIYLSTPPPYSSAVIRTPLRTTPHPPLPPLSVFLSHPLLPYTVVCVRRPGYSLKHLYYNILWQIIHRLFVG